MLDTSVLEIIRNEEPVTQSNIVPLKPRSTKLNSEPIDIMLIEDTFSDALLTRMSLDATKIPYNLATLRRGYELVSHLQQHKDNLPDVIFLDLGLPDMDGFEVLAHLAEQSALIRATPIVVLTAHKHFDFIQKSYPLYIFSYIHKPCNEQHMRDVLNRISTWKAKHSVC